MKPTDYAYSVGRIRALEKRLLNNTQFNNLIELKARRELLDTIIEHPDYSAELEACENYPQAREILNASLASSRELALKLLLGEELFPTKAESDILKRYYRAQQDLGNIEDLIRQKLYAGEIESFDFIEQFDHTPYSRLIRAAFSEYQEEKSFILFDKLKDDYLMNIIQPAKYISFGTEPVRAWYLARANEVKMLKMIVQGEFFNIDKDILRKRLNLSYV